MTDSIIELKVPPRVPNLLPSEYGNFRYFVADLVSRFTFFAYGSNNEGFTPAQPVTVALAYTQVVSRLSSTVIHNLGLVLDSLTTNTKDTLNNLINSRTHSSTRFLYALWQAVQQTTNNQAVATFNPQTLQLPKLNSQDLPNLTSLLYVEFVDFVKRITNRYWDACEAAPLTQKGMEQLIRTMPEDQAPPPSVLHFAKHITPLAFKLSTADLKGVLQVIGSLCRYDEARLSEILTTGFAKVCALKELFALYVLEVEHAPEPSPAALSEPSCPVVNSPAGKAEPWGKVEPWEEADAATLWEDAAHAGKSYTKIMDQLEADNCALRAERDYYAEVCNALKQQAKQQAAQIKDLQSRLNNPAALNGTKPALVGLNGFGLQVLED